MAFAFLFSAPFVTGVVFAFEMDESWPAVVGAVCGWLAQLVVPLAADKGDPIASYRRTREKLRKARGDRR